MSKKKFFKIENKKIILATYGEAGISVLSKIFEYNIPLKNILVFTHNLKNNHRLIQILKMYKLKYIFDSEKTNFIKTKFLKFKPNYFLSFYFRNKIKENLIHLPKCYSLNMHPSLLPRYAGCFTNCWNILNNEKYTGITFHYLSNKFDSGNIIFQKKIKINKNDTAFSLHYKLINLASEELYNTLKKIFLTSTSGKKQNFKLRTYYNRKLPYGGKPLKNWSGAKKKLFYRAMYFPPFDFRKI